MFTGIIEEIGIVGDIKTAAYGAVLSIECSKILSDVSIGDSISINGACQTVTKFSSDSFTADVSQETLDVSTLKYFKRGDKVNLERAMSANGRFGGHIVSGHVEGTGKFVRKVSQGSFDNYYFSSNEDISKYIIYKGSITVNGISLTVASLENNIFSVAVIPYTAQTTILQDLKIGDYVNLEPDIFAKYIEKFISKADNNSNKNITLEYLQQNGF